MDTPLPDLDLPYEVLITPLYTINKSEITHLTTRTNTEQDSTKRKKKRRKVTFSVK